MRWKRPDSVPKGQVWSRFQGKETNGQPAQMYQIRDMDEGIRKQCLDMMQDTFLDDEPLCQVLDIKNDPASVTTIRNNWEAIADQGMCVACFTEEEGRPQELVGFNILMVKSIDDEEENFDSIKGEQWKKLLQILTQAEQMVDVFQHFGVNEYMTSSGLTVARHHRGQNIGARIIEARKEMCKAFSISAVATVFTAITSQVLAAKCGYSTLADLPYSDVRHCGLNIADCGTASAKLMAIRFDFH